MLKIVLNNPEATFVPGQQINGYVAWSDLAAGVTRIEARLIWYTSGKGDRDCEVRKTVKIEGPTAKGELNFEFTAPVRPCSFSGQLITLTWAIEAIVFPSMDAEQAELIISPDGREVTLYS